MKRKSRRQEMERRKGHFVLFKSQAQDEMEMEMEIRVPSTISFLCVGLLTHKVYFIFIWEEIIIPYFSFSFSSCGTCCVVLQSFASFKKFLWFGLGFLFERR